MRHSKTRSIVVGIFLTLLFALATTGIAALLLFRSMWGNVSMEQILFHLAVPLAGGVDEHLGKIIFLACAGVFVATAFYACICFLTRSMRWAVDCLALTILILAFFAEKDLGVGGWIVRQFQTTAIFDEVPSRGETGVIFPGQKRNLLLIHMESMEGTFNDAEIMGAELLPELARLQKENFHFSGFRQVRGTEWTTGGITAAVMGLPLLLPIGKNDYGGYASFLPSAPSLYDVLDENGYAMEFLFPNDCSFGGIKNLLATHAPRAAVKDLLWFSRARSDVGSNRGNGWGLRDRYIYERLKEDLLLRASSSRPYAIFLETIDTHGPDTYYFVDPDVHLREQFHDFRDVLRASSAMTGELIDWITKQDFAKNLTIVLIGDHLWMGDSVAGRPLGENRATLNLFINPVCSPETDDARIFSTPDFAPTILEAIGAKLPDRRFGIGTSLFSSRKTMIEDLGEDKYVSELGKNSLRYREFFTRLPEEKFASGKNFSVDDFSSGRPEFIFSNEEIYLHRSGTFRFAIDNGSGTALSSTSENPVRLRALLYDDLRIISETIFDLPRDILPNDIETVEGNVPQPQDGNYTLRLELINADGTPVTTSSNIHVTVASNWLWAKGLDGLSQDECDVLQSGAPLAAFPGTMEVYYHGGTVFFKLLDKNLTPDEIILCGDGISQRARKLRRAQSDSFRWAAANFDSLPVQKFETGYQRDGTKRTMEVSLLPALKDVSLREETDFASYVKKLAASDYLILAAENDDLQNSFLLSSRGGKIICAKKGSSPLHFDGEAYAYLDLNTHSAEETYASPSGMKLSLRADGLEGETVQRGMNFAVYDTERRLFIDRAAFDFYGSFDDLENLFAGKISVEEWTSRCPSDARLIEHRPPDFKVPLERGAAFASWQNIYAVRYLGRIWIQVPWEQAFKIRLLCGPEGKQDEFAPIERAVTASFDGLLCCISESENWDHAEIGFISEDGGKISEIVDLTALNIETDFQCYLRQLANPDYAVFFSVLYAGEKRLTQTHKKLFAALGLDMSLAAGRHQSYVAVVNGGEKIYEESSERRIEKNFSLDGHDVRMVSTGEDAGFESSIKIDGEEFSDNSLGLNIVVYDKKMRRVVDSVSFSTYSTLASSRKHPQFSRQKNEE